MSAVTRLPKELYYLEIAKAVASRSTCLSKHYGAVIVQNDHIVSTGYNGAPRGLPNCSDSGECFRTSRPEYKRGMDYSLCKSVHGEANAIINASPEEMFGATMYLYGFDCKTNRVVDNPDCCIMCKRMIINSGIEEVIFADCNGLAINSHPTREYGYHVIKVHTWIDDYNADTLGY